jgi:hypothetical protein
VAIAHKILVSIYHMFSQQVSYNDLGDLYLDKLNRNHLTRTLVHRLERLGYLSDIDTSANRSIAGKIIFMVVYRLPLRIFFSINAKRDFQFSLIGPGRYMIGITDQEIVRSAARLAWLVVCVPTTERVK